MKSILLLILFSIGLSFSLLAQDRDSTAADTTVIEMNKRTIVIYTHESEDTLSIKKEDDKLSLNTTLDFGVNGYLTPTNSLALPSDLSLMELDYSKSRSFAFNFLLEGVDFAKKRIFLTTGFGLDFKSYQFKNEVFISPSNDSTEFIASGLTHDKYKLKATYFQVPAMIGFRLGKIKKPLTIEFGAIAGYKIGSKVKEKYQLNDEKYKTTIKDDYNLSPFKLTATARIRIAGIGIFANYGLTPLFENNKAPELYPFTVGITLGSI